MVTDHRDDNEDIPDKNNNDAEYSSHGDNRGTVGRLNRRSLLQAAGTFTAASLFAGGTATMASTASAKTASDFQFDQVLNAVDDLGADPNGNEDVVPIITNNYQSNTKIEFPPGEYRLGSRWIDNDSAVSNFGLVGTGSSPRDVQFLVPDGRFNGQLALALWGPKSDHLFKNWSVQLTDNGDRSYAMQISLEDGSLFEDLEWLGRVAGEETSVKGYVTCIETTTQDGVNTIRRLTFGKDAPAVRPEYPDGRYAIYMHTRHVGENVFDDLHIERMSSSAFRLGSCPGVLTVLGGYFANNNNGNIRLSGGDHPSKHSVVDGAVAVQDNVTQPGNSVHIDNSDDYHAGVVFRNCDIISTDSTAGQPVIASPDWADHGSITFQNCRVQNDIDQLTINIDDVDMSDDTITIDQCSFTGSGRGISVEGREGSVIQNSCFDMPNGSISGLETQNISTSGCVDSISGDSQDTDTSVAVSTDSASTGETSATLKGSLDDLGGASSSDVYFEYRQAGNSSWSATAVQARSSTGSFSRDVGDLSSGTDYEFRAAADASDGDADTGSTATFTTDSESLNGLEIDGSNIGQRIPYEITVSGDIVKGDRANDNDTISGSTADGQVNGGIDTYEFSGGVTDVQISEDVPIYVNGSRLDLSQFSDSTPSVDRYEITEAESRNPHANITAEWDVSDPDGDLATGLVEVVDSSGTVVDSSETSIGGDGHYGVDYFEIKHVDGETFDVRLTVTDANGNQATATRTVTE
jgi:hypothetical protein